VRETEQVQELVRKMQKNIDKIKYTYTQGDRTAKLKYLKKEDAR
jgi:hypothetical protein